MMIEQKGTMGEYLIEKTLYKNSGLKLVLKNIYLFNDMNEICEIDLIMIHESGIYIFESKNYSGWIFGNEKDQYWTQVLKNNQKNKFYNPIKQNNKHIQILHSIIKDPHIPYYNTIVFGNLCELKKIETYSTALVCNLHQLHWKIQNNINVHQYWLNKNTMDYMYYEIMKHQITNPNIINQRIEKMQQYKK